MGPMRGRCKVDVGWMWGGCRVDGSGCRVDGGGCRVDGGFSRGYLRVSSEFPYQEEICFLKLCRKEIGLIYLTI